MAITKNIGKNDDSIKKYGFKNQVVIADGTVLTGRYVMMECTSLIPSHDPIHGFQKFPGFPLDENGNTANDRDYEHDHDAQRITRQIAANLDSRAAQSPIIIDGKRIVFSGNGRAMARQLAAVDATDGKYLSFLQMYGAQYGFDLDCFLSFHHPTIAFEVDSSISLPYTSRTFARFNSQEMKSMSKTETAIKFGKMIDDSVYHRIIDSINLFDTLGEFYADKEASMDALKLLQTAGIIGSVEWPRMIDMDVISDEGKTLLENVLIGKSFAMDPDAVRKISAHKLIRKAIISALMEISNNSTLGSFSLEKELVEAVNLTVDALNAGYRPGDTVSAFARQIDMFTGETAGDPRNELVGIIANTLNSKKTTLLKRIYSTYNNEASQSASGQTDLFSTGCVRSRDEILRDCAKLFRVRGAKQEQKNPAQNGEKQKMTLEEAIRFLRNLQESVA